jgi:hypothetical protein
MIRSSLMPFHAANAAGVIFANPAATAAPDAGSVSGGSAITSKKDLGDFMKEKLNPAFSDASFYLFHHRAKTPAEAEKVQAAFDNLKAAVGELDRFSAPHSDATPFRIHVVQLQIAARALADADPEQRVVWFNQMSAVCNSCHEVYRDEQ